jgi:hypothetical protein
MLTFTKQDSIVIAVTLGIMLSVPLLAPALYGTSTITLHDQSGDRLEDLSERHGVGGDHGVARSPGRSLNCSLSRFSI